jgi:hypothetical protein
MSLRCNCIQESCNKFLYVCRPHKLILISFLWGKFATGKRYRVFIDSCFSHFFMFSHQYFEAASLFSEFAYDKKLPCGICYCIVAHSSLKRLLALSFQADFVGLRFETAEPPNQEFSSHIAWRGRMFLLLHGTIQRMRIL